MPNLIFGTHRLLNHRLGAITNKIEGVLTAVAEVYNVYAYMPEMRDAIARWEAHLASLLRLKEAA
jgi:hypothetical protein